jgi:hypothetical protein
LRKGEEIKKEKRDRERRKEREKRESLVKDSIEGKDSCWKCGRIILINV